MDDVARTDLDPAIAEVLDDAFAARIDVETAARHLWIIHSEARRQAAESASPQASTAGPPRAPRRQRMPRAAVPVLALVMMMSMSGVAVAASQNSVPGDVLYGVKRTGERAQLILTRNPSSRAQLQLEFAQNRLEEIHRVADRRPEVVLDLVSDLGASLADVRQAPPDVVAEVAPRTEEIRQRASREIAALGLPPEIDVAVEVALTEVPSVAPTPTSTGIAVATATSSPSPDESKTPVASQEPKDEQVVAELGLATPTASATPGVAVSATATPVPSVSGEPTATPTPRPTVAPATAVAASPVTGPATAGPRPTTSPTAQPVPTGTDTEHPDEDLSDGREIVPRPHPDDAGGESRGGEEDPAPTTPPRDPAVDATANAPEPASPADAGTAAAPDGQPEPAPQEPPTIYTRPSAGRS